MGIFKFLPDPEIYFSKIQNSSIYSYNGKYIGKITDLFVEYEDIYPLVLAIKYKVKDHHYYVPWSDIKYFSYKQIILKENAHIRRGKTYPKVFQEKILTGLLSTPLSGSTVDYPSIGKVILDKQIVDTHGKKVVRVNDIHFMKVSTHLRVTQAAVGLRSLIRRLGFEKLVDSIVRFINSKAKYLTKDSTINWKYVHAISDKSIQHNVKLNVTNENIEELHPADLADILEDLNNRGREKLFESLDPEIAAQTLSEIEQDIQVSLINGKEPQAIAKILENMGTDEAADILSELRSKEAFRVIEKIEDDEFQEEVKELLAHEEDSAGGIMSTEVFQVSPDHRRSQVILTIQKDFEDIESVYDICVIDKKEKLLGTCSLKNMLIQPYDMKMADIMNHEDMKILPPETHWRDVAEFMSKYNLISVPIIDNNRKLLGTVTVDDILPWLLKEKT